MKAHIFVMVTVNFFLSPIASQQGERLHCIWTWLSVFYKTVFRQINTKTDQELKLNLKYISWSSIYAYSLAGICPSPTEEVYKKHRGYYLLYVNFKSLPVRIILFEYVQFHDSQEVSWVQQHPDRYHGCYNLIFFMCQFLLI